MQFYSSNEEAFFETSNILSDLNIKVGLSPSKTIFFICFNDGTSKMMKNVFYFILKALFILKIFKLLSCVFRQVEKVRKIRLISKFMTSQPG